VDQKTKRFIFNYIVRPPLLLVGSVVRPLYWLLYGWWGEKRFVAKQQERLTREVRSQFSFLFSNHNAKTIPNGDIGHLALLQCPVVTLAAEGLLFRFIHWRDERQLHIASERLPHEWQELSKVLNVMEPDKFSRYPAASFEDSAHLLEQHLDLVTKAFSSDRYTDVKDQLEHAYRHDMAATRQLQTEINRRLYPDD
jgi:hypothetical protein